MSVCMRRKRFIFTTKSNLPWRLFLLYPTSFISLWDVNRNMNTITVLQNMHSCFETQHLEVPPLFFITTITFRLHTSLISFIPWPRTVTQQNTRSVSLSSFLQHHAWWLMTDASISRRGGVNISGDLLYWLRVHSPQSKLHDDAVLLVVYHTIWQCMLLPV